MATERCSNPSCEQHWPADPDARVEIEAAMAQVSTERSVRLATWEPPSGATILEDIQRATAVINAAPAYKHDCQTQGCADE